MSSAMCGKLEATVFYLGMLGRTILCVNWLEISINNVMSGIEDPVKAL